jgi:hypothetical protein
MFFGWNFGVPEGVIAPSFPVPLVQRTTAAEYAQRALSLSTHRQAARTALAFE